MEVYYNSRQFTCTLKAFENEFASPYSMFYFMGEYYRRRGLAGISHNRIARYEILFDIIRERLTHAADRRRQPVRRARPGLGWKHTGTFS